MVNAETDRHKGEGEALLDFIASWGRGDFNLR